MSQWVRLWEDMPNDPKWRVVARRAKRPLAEVLAVFVHMMTNASASDRRGSLEGWSDEDVATAIDMETEHVTAIREAMQGKTLDGDHLTGWEKRQPLREDGAAERSRAWREEQKRKRNESERTRTQPNAQERPEEKRIDTDTEKKDRSSLRSDHTPLPDAKTILGEVLAPETVTDLIAHRKAIKSPISPGAAKGLAHALSAYGDAEAGARAMMTNGWRGFRAEWMKPAARAGPGMPVKRNPHLQALQTDFGYGQDDHDGPTIDGTETPHDGQRGVQGDRRAEEPDREGSLRQRVLAGERDAERRLASQDR